MNLKGQGLFAPEQLAKLLLMIVAILLMIGLLDLVFNKGESIISGVMSFLRNLLRGAL